jgi:hypothetical protein
MVPRGSPRLGHVAPHNLPKPCHVSQHDLSKCQPIQKCQLISTTSPLPRQRTVMPCQPVRTIQTVQSAQFFLPVWRFEQIAISLVPDVRLRRNELCWVRDDDGYALVHFEAIPRTLIFGLKFDPWSRF